MKTHTIKTYTIDEHPDPDLVYDWVRNNWHDLGDNVLQESLESLKGFAAYYDAKLDYSFGINPDRGEHITIKIEDDNIADLSGVRLYKYLDNHYALCPNQYTNKLEATLSGSCPFTGVCYDETLLDAIRDFMKKPDDRTFQDLLTECGDNLLDTIHKEGEHIYSDEGLKETLSANEYDFKEDGSIF